MKRVGIIGAGAWCTALAVIANRAGSEVTLWTRNPFVLESVNYKSRNNVYLPDVFLDPAISVTDNLSLACQSELVLLVVPSQYMRTTCIAMSDYLDPTVPLVVCAKGIER